MVTYPAIHPSICQSIWISNQYDELTGINRDGQPSTLAESGESDSEFDMDQLDEDAPPGLLGDEKNELAKVRFTSDSDILLNAATSSSSIVGSWVSTSLSGLHRHSWALK